MKTKKDKFFLVGIFFILSIIGIFNYNKNISNNKNNVELIDVSENSDTKLEEKDNENNTIMIHIDGEIEKPDLYTVDKNTRLKELIDKAGGLKDTADIKKINYALKLKDEMKIIIPKIGEETESDFELSNIKNNEENLININLATEDELCKLSGIGKGKAKLIIEYRKNNKFNKIEDITKVSGIGNKTFEKIKDSITVD